MIQTCPCPTSVSVLLFSRTRDTENGHGQGKKMIRKARLRDVKEMQRLIKLNSTRGEMLPRSLSELYDNIRDFFISTQNRSVAGICALHVCWEDLGEIRSLAVDEKKRRRGIGAKLVKACLEESKMLGVKRVFALTYQPKFFERLGFKRVDKSVLPHKIWTDCLKCVKFPDCDEIAVVKELK
jgi:amino-acid N-acetyltransferase